MISEFMYAVAPDHVLMRHRGQMKERERNIVTAMLSIVVIATLATSLAHPQWFSLKGGGCSHKFIGIQEFFYVGYFETVSFPKDKPDEAPPPTSLVYFGLNEELRNCVTPSIVNLQRTVAALCFLAILCSLGQFFLDTIGVSHKWLRIIRRNAVGSVLTVLNCVSIIGLCYYIATLMEQQQEMTKSNPGAKVEVKFDISYYLVTIAGSVAIIASAVNLLQSYPRLEEQSESGLLDDYDGAETFTVGISHSQVWPYRRDTSHLRTVPPPPPYTP